MITAYAIVWPNDKDFLVFRTKQAAEDNLAWFQKNNKKDRNGIERGSPVLIELYGRLEYECGDGFTHALGDACRGQCVNP